MKRVLLASVSVLAVAYASAALAGSSSTYLLQTGTGQQATIDQSGGSSNSVNGTDGQPFVQQNSWFRYSNYYPVDGAGGNVITITQDGNNNSVTGGPYGYPAQSGTDNHATVLQHGNGGDVTVTQVGHHNGTTGLLGSITQEATTSGNHAYLVEYGDYNEFRIDQSGSSGTQNHNYATLIQGAYDAFANYNTADISQTGGPNTGHILASTQLGKYNALVSVQTGTSLGNNLTSYQNGSGANVTQKNSLSNTQTGSDEQAFIGTSSTNGQNGYSLTITNNQSGAGDRFYVGQGSFAALDFTKGQLGHDNQISNTQSGSGNKSWATQQAGSSSNSITIDQGGSFNQIWADQKGTLSQATLTQNGTSPANNVIVAAQNGAGGTVNTINMTQTSASGSYAYLGQGADYGLLTLTSSTTMSFLVTPVSGNSITGNQSGANQLAGVSQSSNSNTASFSQAGSNNVASIRQ